MFGDLFFVLSNKRLLNSSGRVLSHDELIKLWAFYNLIKGGSYSKLIMRGESDENLDWQFLADTKNPAVLAECLFMTGEKARICWNNRCFVDPDNTSVRNFEKICESLYYHIRDGLRGKGERAERLREYARKNEDFCKALENIPGILNSYSALGEKDRVLANLHYLSISHTINSFKYKNASGFVSATTEAQVADKFAVDAMIYGWVPKSTNVTNVRGRTIDNVAACYEKSLRQLGLPYPVTAVYPEQSEISLRCGFLPHFIIGFSAGKEFYVNPAVFTTIDRMNELTSFRALSSFKRDIQLFGMDVNQEHFEDFLRQTGYRRYFTFDGDEYVIHRMT